jgi:hypothetical protein
VVVAEAAVAAEAVAAVVVVATTTSSCLDRLRWLQLLLLLRVLSLQVTFCLLLLTSMFRLNPHLTGLCLSAAKKQKTWHNGKGKGKKNQQYPPKA